jgi:ribonuclease D
MPHHLITHTDELEAFCRAAKKAPFITVDTEFLREKTYYPKLCVIQLATPDTHSEIAVDALSPDVNLAPLEDLLFDPQIVKVFHAARQDLEIMTYLFDGRAVAPVFDTQVAAMVTGYGDQIGYQSLVQQICHVTLDKSNQFTNWSRRPLTDAQIEYALADVTYLRDVYLHLKDLLDTKERWSWVHDEMDKLHDPETHVTHPEDVWTRVKMKGNKRESLVALQELAAWREREAQERDKPRLYIIRDEVISELARQLPKNMKDLENIRGLPEKYRNGKYAQLLLDIIQTALERPKSTWPKKEEKNILPPEFGPALEMLKMLLKIQATEFGIVPRLIATPQDLEILLMKSDPELQILHGWRYEIFGKQAQSLINGETCLTLEKNKVRYISRNAAQQSQNKD